MVKSHPIFGSDLSNLCSHSASALSIIAIWTRHIPTNFKAYYNIYQENLDLTSHNVRVILPHIRTLALKLNLSSCLTMPIGLELSQSVKCRVIPFQWQLFSGVFYSAIPYRSCKFQVHKSVQFFMWGSIKATKLNIDLAEHVDRHILRRGAIPCVNLSKVLHNITALWCAYHKELETLDTGVYNAIAIF